MFRNWLLAVALCCAPCVGVAEEEYEIGVHRSASTVGYDIFDVTVSVTPGGSTGNAGYNIYWGKEGSTLTLMSAKSMAPTSPTWVATTGGTNWTSLFPLYGATTVTYILKVTRVKSGEPTEERMTRYKFKVLSDYGIQNPPLPPDQFHSAFAAYFNGTCPPRTLNFKLMLHHKVRTPQTVELKVDSVSQGTFSISPGMYGGFINDSFTRLGVVTSQGSFSYQWLVAGTVVASGSFGCEDEIVNNWVINSGDYEQPAGPVNPGVETPPGSTPPSVDPYTPPSSTPPAPTPPPANPYTPSGPVSTQEEMYAAVRKALEDAGNNDANIGTPDRSPPSMQEDLEKRGKLDDIQGELDESVARIGQAKTGLTAKVTQIGGLLDLPSVGQAQSVTYGTVTIGGHSAAIVLDFAGQFSGAINLLRQIVLFAASVVFVIVCAKEIQKGI